MTTNYGVKLYGKTERLIRLKDKNLKEGIKCPFNKNQEKHLFN